MQDIAILGLVVGAALAGGGGAMALRLLEAARRAPAIGEGSEFRGARGVAVTAIHGSDGWIVVQNQRWRATRADGSPAIGSGSAVRVLGRRDGLVLLVEPLELRASNVVPFPVRRPPLGEPEAA